MNLNINTNDIFAKGQLHQEVFDENCDYFNNYVNVNDYVKDLDNTDDSDLTEEEPLPQLISNPKNEIQEVVKQNKNNKRKIESIDENNSKKIYNVIDANNNNIDYIEEEEFKIEFNIEFNFGKEVDEGQREKVKSVAIEIFKLIPTIDPSSIRKTGEENTLVNSVWVLLVYNCITQKQDHCRLSEARKKKMKEVREIYRKIMEEIAQNNIKFNFKSEKGFNINKKIDLMCKFKNYLDLVLEESIDRELQRNLEFSKNDL